MKSPFTHQEIPSNVHGWERAASIAGGLLFLGKGLRRGGLLGLAQLAIGGAALTRGMTGRCEAKRIFEDMKAQPAHRDPAADMSVAEPVVDVQPERMADAYQAGPLGGNTDTGLSGEVLGDGAPVHPQPDVNPGRNRGSTGL